MNKDFRAPADSIILEKLKRKAQDDQQAMRADLIGQMTRKPLAWEEADRKDFDALRPEAKEFVKGLPVIPIDIKEPLDTLSKSEEQWFVVQHQGQYYLVDTEGANYCRYVLCLNNFSGQDIKVQAQDQNYNPKKIKLEDIIDYIGKSVLLRMGNGELVEAKIESYDVGEYEKGEAGYQEVEQYDEFNESINEYVEAVNFRLNQKDADYLGINSDPEGIYQVETTSDNPNQTLYDIGIESFIVSKKKAQEEVVPGLDEMIADEKAAPADYRMLVKELEKIGELDAAKRLQKKIIEDEKDHFKYLKDLKEHLKNRGEEETANVVEAMLIKESSGVYLKDILPLSLQDVRDVIKKIFDTGEGVSTTKVTQAVRDLVEEKMQAETNVVERRLIDQVVQKAVLEFLKTGQPIAATASLKKIAPFKNPEQEAAMFANPESREVAKKWKDEYGNARGWKQHNKNKKEAQLVDEDVPTDKSHVVDAKNQIWKGYKAYKEGHRERGGHSGYKGKTYFKKKSQTQNEEPLEVTDVPVDVDGRKLEVGDIVETIGNSQFHIPVGAKCKILGLQLYQLGKEEWLAHIDLGEYGNIIPTHGLKKVVAGDTEAVEDKRNKDKNNMVTISDTGSHSGLEEGKMGERGTLIPENPTREFKLAKTIAARLKKGQEGTVKDDFITRGFYPKVKDTTKVEIPKEDKKFKWTITKDLIDTNRVGTGNTKSSEGLTYKFRLKDDDGELYYEGICNGWNFGGEVEFAPLDWASNYAGATSLWYLEEGKWLQL
jgi:rubrerythrin